MSEEGDFDDEYRGVGGTFVIDPATGKRVPVDEYVIRDAESGLPNKKNPKAAIQNLQPDIPQSAISNQQSEGGN